MWVPRLRRSRFEATGSQVFARETPPPGVLAIRAAAGRLAQGQAPPERRWNRQGDGRAGASAPGSARRSPGWQLCGGGSPLGCVPVSLAPGPRQRPGLLVLSSAAASSGAPGCPLSLALGEAAP